MFIMRDVEKLTGCIRMTLINDCQSDCVSHLFPHDQEEKKIYTVLQMPKNIGPTYLHMIRKESSTSQVSSYTSSYIYNGHTYTSC
jgi:hypothetical protein